MIWRAHTCDHAGSGRRIPDGGYVGDVENEPKSPRRATLAAKAKIKATCGTRVPAVPARTGSIKSAPALPAAALGRSEQIRVRQTRQDSRPQVDTDVTEVDRQAVSSRDGSLDSEDIARAHFEEPCSLRGIVEIELDDLVALLRRLALARPADEARLRQRKRKDVLSTFPVPHSAQGPRSPPSRLLEIVDDDKMSAPVHLQPAPVRGNADRFRTKHPAKVRIPSLSNKDCLLRDARHCCLRYPASFRSWR